MTLLGIHIIKIPVGLLLGLLTTIPTIAQTSASARIRGTVYTERGDKASPAIVMISTADGRTQRMTRTNAQGSFVFSGLPAGSYVMQGCSEQFGPSEPAPIELTIGEDATQDLKMEAGFVKTAEPACAMPPPPVEYTGAIMSFDLNGDVKDFFRAVASVSQLDVNVDAAISRNINVHLKEVPWDLALDVVLRNSGLGGELDGNVLRISAANPLLGQDRILMGTLTIEGKVTEFNLRNPRTLLQVNAPSPDGNLQNWPVEWESADYLTSTGLKPGTLKAGDQVVLTGNLTRSNTIQLIGIRRPSDGFSWGEVNMTSSAPSDGVMFVSSTSK